MCHELNNDQTNTDGYYIQQLVFTGTDEDFGRRNIVLLCLKRYYEGKLLRRNIVLSRPERCNEKNFVRRNIFLFCQRKNKSWIEGAAGMSWINRNHLLSLSHNYLCFTQTNIYLSPNTYLSFPHKNGFFVDAYIYTYIFVKTTRARGMSWINRNDLLSLSHKYLPFTHIYPQTNICLLLAEISFFFHAYIYFSQKKQELEGVPLWKIAFFYSNK